MDRICRQRGGNAVYDYLGIVRMTMETHRYIENRFDYLFLKGFDVSTDFRQWWNPQKFDWTYSKYLPRYWSHNFEQWWDPDRYNWQSSSTLIRYCRQYFHIWWDPEKFDWKPRSTRFLMNYCKEHFDTWWDPESFPWETNVIYLIKDFNDKFETWWDEKKFPWGTKFLFGNMSAEEILTQYCVDYFPIWYCADHFQLTARLCELLRAHCGDFKDTWAQDYLLYKLAK
ncbi:MAG: hypothetical protein LWW97_02965 [Deltaproteobacteria bacterium]|nr:hypothetical protein [Deltaproteobacteria bacterium]